MFNSVYVIKKLNASHDDNVRRVSELVERVASQHNIPCLGTSKEVASGTLIVAIGGDGTMLEAMRLSARWGATAMGINLGKVGFLTDFNDDTNLEHDFQDIISSDITSRTERRLMLHATKRAGNIPGFDALAGNEIVVSSDEPDTMITYRMLLDGFDTGIHRANSVIISTPTGSTAYSLSAGGALLMPGLDVIQIVPVAPITLTSRPLVVGGDTLITIQAWGGGVSVRRDGQKQFSSAEPYNRESPFNLFIEAYPNSATMLHSKEWTFFEVLSSKLGWIQR